MKKQILVVLLSLLILFPLTAATHISVPLDHQVYDILESSELKGYLSPLPIAKPYPKSNIVNYLKILLANDSLTTAERTTVKSLIEEFLREPTEPGNFNELLYQGAYASDWEKYNIKASLGVEAELEFTKSLSSVELYDSRNVGRAYIRGDILEFASFNMDFGFRMDHYDPRLFLPNDFTISTEGKSDTIFAHGDTHTFYYGLDMHPELSLSFLDGNLLLRWASIKRDIGVGVNNMMLSGSARPYDGIDLAVKLTPWLDYHFTTGSLGKYWVIDNQVGVNKAFFDEYFFSGGQQDTRNDNNFSAHRVEVSLPWNLTFGIYESVIYRKRFELAYLNPFSILMFQQNILGDFDNVLAGIDLQWRLPGNLRLFGTAATTEMNEINPMRFFKAPRNVLSAQGGFDISLPIGNFSKLTFQYTYISPFFYTHYPVELADDGIEDYSYELMYVNKGENLGYPLRPNSDEFLVSTSLGLGSGYRVHFTAKYQRRSGQYGFNMDEYLVYKAYDAGEYPDKDFAGNLFEKTFGLNIGISKRFSNLPLTVYGKYLYSATNNRIPQPVKVWDFNKEPTPALWESGDPAYDLDDDRYHVILYSVENEPWSGWDHSHALQIGVSIWH